MSLTSGMRHLCLACPRPVARSSAVAATRQVSTSPSAYPYAPSAAVITPSASTLSASTSSASQLLPPLSTSLLRTLNLHLTSQHPQAENYTSLFSRRSPNRLLPGSVVTVSSYTSLPTPENPNPSINTFSGVLIAIRRRHAGRDHSIRLRNLVGRTGVEISFKIFSPMVREIKVVSRAANSGPAVTNKDGTPGIRKKPALKAFKRAKAYFVREEPSRLSNVASIVKVARERENLLTKKRK